jgi:hypothetical protein
MPDQPVKPPDALFERAARARAEAQKLCREMKEIVRDAKVRAVQRQIEVKAYDEAMRAAYQRLNNKH